MTRRDLAKQLLGLFFKLKGSEFRDRYLHKDVIVQEWIAVFEDIIVQLQEDKVSVDKFAKALEFGLAGKGSDWWPDTFRRPRNVKEHLDTLLDAYESSLAIERRTTESGCTCQKINGDRCHPETGHLLPCDWKCPQHGKGGTATMVGRHNIEWFNLPGQAVVLPEVPKQIAEAEEPIEAPAPEESKTEVVSTDSPSLKGKVFKKDTKTCKNGQYHQEDFSHKLCTTCGGTLVD